MCIFNEAKRDIKVEDKKIKDEKKTETVKSPVLFKPVNKIVVSTKIKDRSEYIHIMGKQC